MSGQAIVSKTTTRVNQNNSELMRLPQEVMFVRLYQGVGPGSSAIEDAIQLAERAPGWAKPNEKKAESRCVP